MHSISLFEVIAEKARNSVPTTEARLHPASEVWSRSRSRSGSRRAGLALALALATLLTRLGTRRRWWWSSSPILLHLPIITPPRTLPINTLHHYWKQGICLRLRLTHACWTLRMTEPSLATACTLAAGDLIKNHRDIEPRRALLSLSREDR